jgi:hypothetical protein
MRRHWLDRAGAAVAFVAPLVLAACEIDRMGAAGAVVRDSAGITIVENPVAEPADIARWTVDTTPFRTIGVAMGDSAYEFASIGGVRQLPDGKILVLNGRGESAFEFRFFDSTGTHLATHGRRGEGPGEYRWVNYFGPAGGDTVIAVDFPNSRINWISASTGYLRSSRLDETGFKKVLGEDAYGVIETMVPLGDSVYAVKAFRRMPNATSPFERGTSYHIVDLQRGTAHEVARYAGIPAQRLRLAGGNVSISPLDAGQPVHVVDVPRYRVCAGNTSATALTCVDRDGKRRSIRWTADRVPYTDEDRRLYEERVRATWSRPGAASTDANEIIAATQRPEHHTPFVTLQVDTEGNLWILEPVLAGEGKRAARYRVFDPDGELIAFADSFPARNTGLGSQVHIGSTTVARVIRDADDVQLVGLFRIRKPD